MVREEPIFRKCCYCIPLQTCLQTWGCVKVIADIALTFFILMMLALVTDNFRHKLSHRYFNDEHLAVILMVVLMVDAFFMVLLAVGLCKKNVRSLQVFFYYSIYMAVAGAAFAIGMIFYLTPINEYGSNLELLISAIVGGLINTVLDVCIILTLKSEIIKLRNKQLFEFHKLSALKEADIAEPVDEEKLT